MTEPMDYEGSVVQRLSRIEQKLDRLEDRVTDQSVAIIELRKVDVDASVQMRILQDWRLEMTVYLKQIRWTMVVALGAFLVGLVNIVIALIEHP